MKGKIQGTHNERLEHLNQINDCIWAVNFTIAKTKRDTQGRA